jgi:hypothetical protein
MLIGVPVAFTPGFGPHFEMSTEVPPVLEALVVLAVELPPPPAELLLELLLPQPARTSNPSTVNSAMPVRVRAESWNMLTLSPLLRRYGLARSARRWLILVRADPACNKVLLTAKNRTYG